MESSLKSLAKKIRLHVLDMTYRANSSHIGPCLSIVEILVVLYTKILNINPKNVQDNKRDKFILSKAHGSAALYSILAELGFFPIDYLKKFYVNDGILPGHLDKEAVPGIEFSLGALGHGLPVSVGMAIANRHDNNPGKIFVLLGDGECDEGSVWEAVMLASHLKLSNLTVIIDYNKIQNFGRTNEIINQEPIGQRWRSFGWEVYEIDGHNFDELITAFTKKQLLPKVIIAHTVKGKGISFMEDRLEWHYKSPNLEQYKLAIKEVENQ